MRTVALALAAALAAAGLMTFGLTWGEQGKVTGSRHDLGVATGTAGVSSCEVCHLPHDASGGLLWEKDPRAGDERFSGIAPACYSCHDGTVAASGLHVFNAALAQHPVKAGEPGEDCDMCHDPHLAEYGSFLLFPAGANLCKTCHAGGGNENHPLNVDAAERDRTPQDDRWDPEAGDYNGARLWDDTGARAGTHVKCLSCHAAHGAASEILLSMPTEGEKSLCANCHLR